MLKALILVLIENESVSLASFEIVEASLWIRLRHLNPYIILSGLPLVLSWQLFY